MSTRKRTKGGRFKPTKNLIRPADSYSSWSMTDKEINPSPAGADLNLQRFESSTKSSNIAANTTMKAKNVDTEKSHPVITEDHPVVQKILAHIEKEIKPERKEILRHYKYNKYLANLPEEELVTYAIYNRIQSVPAIYEYHNTKELSEFDSNKLVNLMSG